MKRHGMLRKYAYAWITLAFFLGSFGLHWWFGWQAFADEARQHGATPEISEYLSIMGRDTFENWQSEFLQLLWQVCGWPIYSMSARPRRRRMTTGWRRRSTPCCGSPAARMATS